MSIDNPSNAAISKAIRGWSLSPTSAASGPSVVPMLKEDALLGTMSIYHQEVRPFTDKQIELVSHFARQAVIAIESTACSTSLRQRTNDLTESLSSRQPPPTCSRLWTFDLQVVPTLLVESAPIVCS